MFNGSSCSRARFHSCTVSAHARNAVLSSSSQIPQIYPYEQRSVAAALRQFTFLVAQRLVVAEAALASRSSTRNEKLHTARTLQICAAVNRR